MRPFLFGVAVSALFSDFIKAGFGGSGFLQRGFNEIYFNCV
jgi:hypothetical protein